VNDPTRNVRGAVSDPTIVVGLGRFGLSVLERLGETWERLRDATDDPRLGNLRLLHVRGNEDESDDWRAGEAAPRKLADAIGEGDFPLRALDFLFLRALGLVRFHRGTYEVALARDHGMSRDGQTRLRTFVWRELNPDPMRAVDLLALRSTREADLDLFLTPFLERVRAGHAPTVIRDAIIHASRYAQGLDPAPWPLGLDERAKDPKGNALDLLRPDDWRDRVVDAGPRAPRVALDEAMVRSGRMALGDEIQTGHLGTPAERERLHLDESLFDDSFGDAHGQLFGDAGPVSSLVRHGVASGAVARGSLVLTSELERSVAGVGGGSASRAGDGEYWRRERGALDAERVSVSRELRALSLKIVEEFRQRAPLAPQRFRPEPDAPPMGPALQDLDVGAALQEHLAMETKEAIEKALERSRVLRSKYESLLGEQSKALGVEHPDLRTTHRAVAELLRYHGGLLLSRERVRPSSSGQVSASVDAGIPSTASETFERAVSELKKVFVALEKVKCRPGDPERLATLHALSDVRRECRVGHGDDDGAAQLREILGVELSELDEATRQLSRARQLLANHRLARILEDAGHLDEAAFHLTEVCRIRDEELRGEHHRTAEAHRIAAAHALGRIWQAQRRYLAAQCALERVVQAWERQRGSVEPKAAASGATLGDEGAKVSVMSDATSPEASLAASPQPTTWTVSAEDVFREPDAVDFSVRSVLRVKWECTDDERTTFELPAGEADEATALHLLPSKFGKAGPQSSRVFGTVRALRLESSPSSMENKGKPSPVSGKRTLVLEVELDPEAAGLIRLGACNRLTARFTKGGSPKEFALTLAALELHGEGGVTGGLVRPEHQRAIDSHGILALHDLAAVLIARGAIDDALKLLRTELSWRRTHLGWEHPDTLAVAIDLAAAEMELAGPLEDDSHRKEARRALDAAHAGHAPGSIFDPVDAGNDAFDPREILEIPWEVAGWTTRAVRANDGYEVSELPLWLHGFFDSMHEDEGVQAALEEKLRPKLRALGQVCRRGLLELFWEMRIRDRPEVMEEQSADEDALETYRATLQSTDYIAEMLFRPLMDAPKEKNAAVFVRPNVEAFALPIRATQRLADYRPPSSDPRAALMGHLDARLSDLGALPKQARRTTDYIFNEVEVARSVGGDRAAQELTVYEIRRIIREVATHLVDSDFLSQTTERSVGSAPRLAVYLVGDLGEPFARGFAATGLKLLHAELLRAFTAVFKDFRGGYDRNLSVVPILWLPSPSHSAPERVARAEDVTVAVRHEEAAIGDMLMNLRRTISRMPNRDRFIPNVYICSRVNDAGVVDLRESVLQTHDFLSFSVRSELGSDEWLRSLSMGPFGKDFFATFGCVELEVPVERIREYLAGRVARMALGDLLHGKGPRSLDDGSKVRTDAELDAEADAKQLAEHSERVQAALRESCDRLAESSVGGYATPREDLEPEAVIEAYSEANAVGVANVILRGWPPLVAKRGAMDQQIDKLRRVATIAIESAVQWVRKRGDTEVGALRQGAPIGRAIERLGVHAHADRETLASESDALGDAQRDALAEQRPDPIRRVVPIFAGVREQAERVPRREPLRLGVALLVLAGMVGLGVLGHAANLGAGFDRSSQPLEYLLGPLAPWLGGALAGGLGYLALRFYRRRSLRALEDVIAEVPGQLRDIVTGEQDSVWSFLDARVRFAVRHMQRAVAAMRYLQANIDVELVRRVRVSAELAEGDLRHRAEALGVESKPALGVEEPLDEALVGLVAASDGSRPALVEPADVLGVYEDRVGSGEAQRTLIPDVVKAAGSLDAWRERVPFAVTSDLLAVGHAKFADLLEEDSCADARFAPSLRRNLVSASVKLAPGLGLPGYVQGSEGLDDDGIVERARGTVVATDAMSRAAQARDALGRFPLREASVRSHAVYLLTLVQGMAPHLPLLHRRFMGFHDREVGPNFTSVKQGGFAPVHMLTGQEKRYDELYKRFSETEPSSGKKS
jgi:hypothetical protein